MRKFIRNRSTLALAAVAAVMTASFAGSALATDFEFGDGWKGIWSTTVSLGTNVRAQDRNRLLYGPANGHLIGLTNGLGANTTDEGNLNYAKNDRFSTLFKVMSDIEFKNGKMGGLIRAKAWYDYTLNKEDVLLGNQPNGFNGYSAATDKLTQRRPLSDRGFDPLLKFDGIELLDAYVYNTFQGLGGNDVQVRFGKHVLNWGESVFIQGVNQISPIDVPAFRRPGAELKEVFMPVWMVSASHSLGSGMGSLEAFYQFKWEPTPIEAGCGNYWTISGANLTTKPGACNNSTSMDAANLSSPASIAVGAYIPEIRGVKAKDSGEYGLAYRFGVPKLDTEFGLYAMNIHARIPNISLKFGSFPPNYGIPNLAPLAGFWEYPEDMKIYGVSAATTILGWSVSGELSTTRDFRLQTDGNDILFGGFGYGPLAATLAPIAKVNGIYHAGDKINKNQAQINVLQAGNGILNAAQYLFVGEVGYQWNNKRNDKRYNRNFIFGIGPDPTLGGNTCGTFSRQPDGCSSNEGYVTKNSWGYRLLARLEYPNVYNTGVTVFPMVFYSQDVKGYAADGAFLEDRTTTGLGVRFSYMKKYNLEFNYTTYGDKAKFDPLRDRDYYSANASITF